MFLYIAAGDSITYGESASSPGRAYPALVVKGLSARFPQTAGQVLAEPGWTSADLAEALGDLEARPLALASAVTVWIGGNDLAFSALAAAGGGGAEAARRALGHCHGNLGRILRTIRHRSRCRLICCTQYQPFPASPLAVEYVGRLNAVIADAAASHHAAVAPVHEWFEGRQAEWIAGYRRGRLEDALAGVPPVHPNDAGHRAIARRLLPWIENRL
jgi:lysophospholipase L1-like esterase